MQHLCLKSILFTLFFTSFLQPSYGVHALVKNGPHQENLVSKKEQRSKLKSDLKQLRKELKEHKKNRKLKSLAPESGTEKKGSKLWWTIGIIALALGLLVLLAFAGFYDGLQGGSGNGPLAVGIIVILLAAAGIFFINKKKKG